MPEDHEPYWNEETQRYLHWDAVLEEWVPLPDPPVIPEPYWDEERQRFVNAEAPNTDDSRSSSWTVGKQP